jgi:hypothetical protein
MGFGLVIGFIDHLYTKLRTMSSYSTTTNLHNVQITAPTKHFSILLCFLQPFPGNGFWQWRFFSFMLSGPLFTASHAELNWTPNYLCPLLITSRHRRHTKHSSSTVVSYCCIINNLLPSNRNVFTELLPRNCHCLQSYCLEASLYATLFDVTIWICACWNLRLRVFVCLKLCSN